jgi:hypothetical protein
VCYDNALLAGCRHWRDAVLARDELGITRNDLS